MSERHEQTKLCASCGRRIEWRRKWSDCWDEIKYCSKTCRQQRLEKRDHSLEVAILELLNQRPPTASICPSEAAKREFPNDWREMMERVRCAARRLVAKGKITITQKNKPVDPSTAKGPIRLKKL